MGDLEGDLDTFRGIGTAKSDGGFKMVESMGARGTAAHRGGKADGRDLDQGMKRMVVGATAGTGEEGRISVRRRYGYSYAVERCLLIFRPPTSRFNLAVTTIAKQSGPPASFAFTGHTGGPRRASRK